MKVTVIGAGSWGTAFSRFTASQGHSTALWVRRKNQARKIREARENAKYLPGFKLPEDEMSILTSIEKAVSHSRAIFLAVPSFAVRNIVSMIKPYINKDNHYLINLAKGLEKETFNTMSEVLNEEIKGLENYTLSGPSHAEEVAKGDPTAVILAGDLERGRLIQEKFSTDSFRIYLSQDIKGVEYCGAIKNVIAIASGIATGLGYGDNTVSTIISRGLAEMVRFGRSLGAEEKTFFGLAGIGDLVATCTSNHSRNRGFGVKLGKGESPESILDQMDMVVEGVSTVEFIHQLSNRKDISVPITDSLYRVIYEDKDLSREVSRLMSREFKVEKFSSH